MVLLIVFLVMLRVFHLACFAEGSCCGPAVEDPHPEPKLEQCAPAPTDTARPAQLTERTHAPPSWRPPHNALAPLSRSLSVSLSLARFLPLFLSAPLPRSICLSVSLSFSLLSLSTERVRVSRSTSDQRGAPPPRLYPGTT